jgi:hypothetical protein
VNAPTSSPARRERPPASALPVQPRRAGRLAWTALVHLALALLLGTPAVRPHPMAAAGARPGIRARDAVEVGAAHHRPDVGSELGPRLRRSPQPPRAGADAAPLAAAAWGLTRSASQPEPAEAAAADPRNARRPAYFANAPPLPVRST